MNAERLLQLFSRVSEAPDAIPRLRKFILDLAVRGKLVEQDPNDEPVPAFLKKISAEKRSVGRKTRSRGSTSRPNARVAAQEFHELPETWAWTEVGDVFFYDAGIKRAPKNIDQRLWLLELEDIEKDTGRLINRLKVGDRESKSTKSEFRVGDILYGKLRPYLNKVLVADEAGVSTTEIVAIRPILPMCSGYCALAFRRPGFVEYVTRLGQGTKMPRLRTEDAIVAPFPLPPVPEQHRIVAKVDELMSLCDSLEAERDKREATRDRLATASLSRLTAPDVDEEQFKAHADFAIKVFPELTTGPDQIKVLRQTILDLAVRGKLVEQSPIVGPNATLPDEISREQKRGKIDRVLYGDGGLGSPTGTLDESLPNGWRWTTLGLVAESLRYGTSVKCGYKREGVPVLRIPNVSGGTVDLDDLKFGPLSSTQVRDLTLEYEDILLIRSNGSLEIVGRAAVVPREAAGMAFAGYLVRLRPDRSLALGPYLWLVLNSSDVRTQVEKPIRTTVGLKNINLKEFSALTFRLPPLSDQRRIVAMVDQMMIFCNRFSERLGVRSAIMTTLLEGLLTRALAPN